MSENKITAATKLPDAPSALIMLALSDLEKVEQKPDIYFVDMSEWHEAHSVCDPQWDVLAIDGKPSRCAVCFAGAVMAGTLGASPDEDFMPTQFDGPTQDKLYALNHLRLGNVASGLASMRMGMRMDMDMEVTQYEHDAEAFKADMRMLAAALKEEGL